jgi:1,4-dihydroxy-2-naphthoate octaprenyltransferase
MLFDFSFDFAQHGVTLAQRICKKKAFRDGRNMEETDRRCTPQNIVRALRLPFTAASALPYIAGALLVRDAWGTGRFLLGFAAAVCTHLSANLANDIADSRSGADWSDRKFYGLFGGSKLIQEGVLPEVFYLKASAGCAAAALLCVAGISIMMGSLLPAALYALIIGLAWAYSYSPLQLSYRLWGEPVIFLLFGPACVMGGYYIQTGLFPDMRSFLLSLPFGFFTTAILFANEVPDFRDDMKAGKKTWVSITGPERAYAAYLLLTALGFLSIGFNVLAGNLGVIAMASLVLLILPLHAGIILMSCYRDKQRLVRSSRMTIALQALVSLFIIADILL